MEDIKEYLLGGEEVRFDGFVDRQYAVLLKQQRELERRIGIIGNTRKLLEQIRRNDTGKPELYEQPEIFRLKVTKVLSDPATSFSEISTDIHRHLKTCNHPGYGPFRWERRSDERIFRRDSMYTGKFLALRMHRQPVLASVRFLAAARS